MGGEEEADDGVRPRRQERHGHRRIRLAPVPRGRGSPPRSDRDHRPHPRARPRGDRCRRPGGRARLRRRAHAHGRADLLGPARHVVVLARRHDRRHGQLRLHARALRGGQQGSRRPESPAGRGHPGGGDGGRDRLAVDDLPGVPRLPRILAQGNQLRRLHRPLGAAHVRDGRAGLRGAGPRGRPPGHGAGAPRRDPRGRHRLHHLPVAVARDARRPPGCEPSRHLGRGATARRRHGRDERGYLRARR